MKKVLIFTYMLNNYGAVLQAFALQWYLSNHCGLDVRIVDYETDRHRQKNKIFKRFSTNIIIQICMMLATLLRFGSLKKRKVRTFDFKEKNMLFTSKYISKEQLLNNIPCSDVYLSGSDQVFNPNGIDRDVYYLSFDKGNGKKVAYAPSFGVIQYSDNDKQYIKERIEDFDALSCRESEGAEFISSLLDKRIPSVVDPTLLLSVEEWNCISVKPSVKDRYICVYDLNGGENLITIAKQIQEKTGSKIYCITDKAQKKYDVDKQIYDAGPAEFVGWIQNSAYVVTDSFHGTMFSLKFNIPFYTYIAVPSSSGRITNILSRLNLSHRIIENGKASMWSMDNCEMREYSQELDSLISQSKLFINNEICKHEGE